MANHAARLDVGNITGTSFTFSGGHSTKEIEEQFPEIAEKREAFLKLIHTIESAAEGRNIGGPRKTPGVEVDPRDDETDSHDNLRAIIRSRLFGQLRKQKQRVFVNLRSTEQASESESDVNAFETPNLTGKKRKRPDSRAIVRNWLAGRDPNHLDL